MITAPSLLGRATLIRCIALGICMTLISCGESQGPKRLLKFQIYPKDAFVLYLSNESEILLNGGTRNFGGRVELVYKFDAVSVDPDGVVEFKIDVKTAKFPMLLKPLGPALEGQTSEAARFLRSSASQTLCPTVTHTRCRPCHHQTRGGQAEGPRTAVEECRHNPSLAAVTECRQSGMTHRSQSL